MTSLAELTDRRRMRAVAAVLAVSLATPALAEDLVLWDFYHSAEETALQRVIAAYNGKKGSSAPHIRTVSVPFDALPDKISVAVRRLKGPDLFIFAQDRLGGWADDGVLTSIGRFVDAATRERFIPTTMQALTYRGEVFGLPLNYKVITLIYNKDLVRTPPTTTAQLRRFARSFTKRDWGIYGLAYVDTDYYYHAALQNGFGGRVFDQLGTPTLNSGENLAAMGLLESWKSEFLPEQDPSRATVVSLFNLSRAAVVFEGPWFLGDISPHVRYGFAMLPNISEAHDQPMRPWMTVEGLFVTSQCRQVGAAYDFISYATDVESAKVMALEAGQTPANQRAYLDPTMATDERLNGFFRQARVAIPMPNGADMTAVWSPATTALAVIARHGDTPEHALARAQAEVLQEISRRRSGQAAPIGR